MAFSLNELKILWPYLKTSDDQSFVDVLNERLSLVTKQAMRDDLEPLVDAAREQWYNELKVGIYGIAVKLPVDDPLRLAIEAIT